MEWMRILVLGCLLMGAVSAETASPESGHVLVLTYDDEQLPCDRSRFALNLFRGRDVIGRVEIVDGWPEAVSREELERRFPEVAGMGGGKFLVALVPAGLAIEGEELGFSLETTRRDKLEPLLGLPLVDRLYSSKRVIKVEAPGSVTQLFLGPLMQNTQVSRVRIAAPIMPDVGPRAVPLFTVHHLQRKEVKALIPFQGGKPTYHSIYPQEDGSWTAYLLGSGSFFIGAYAYGLAEVKSDGMVVTEDKIDRMLTFQVPALKIEPLVWAILNIEVESLVTVDRCIDVELAYVPNVYAKDPLRTGEHFTKLSLSQVHQIRPSHAQWCVSKEELPAASEAPGGLGGNIWQAAIDEIERINREREVAVTLPAVITPGRCVDRGKALPPHAHDASLRREIRKASQQTESMIFVGSVDTITSIPILIEGQAFARGFAVPAGDLSAWTCAHELIEEGKKRVIKQRVTATDVPLRPFCITTFRVTGDVTGGSGDKPFKSESLVSEPYEIPVFEKSLSAPAVQVNREMSYPPLTAPSVETITMRFEHPVEPHTVFVDVGPAGHEPAERAQVRPTADPSVVEVAYLFRPLPEGVERTVVLREGVQPRDRVIQSLASEVRWDFKGGKFERRQ